jgi:YbbR domain-containing protein
MEDKKISKYIKLLVIGNVISLVLILGMIIFLISATNQQGNINFLKEIKAGTPQNIELRDNIESKDLKNGIYSINIRQNGFSPEGISAISGQQINIEVTNEDTLPHSFVIDGLNIDSGQIQAGQTKQLTIAIPENGDGYVYKSVDESGKAEFKGALIINNQK